MRGRVEADALRALARDAVVAEWLLIVLEVLAEFGFRRVFEPGAQQSERALHPQLRRRAGISVRKRQISRPSRLDAKRHAHQLRAQGVEAGGLGVESDQSGAIEHFQPLGHLLFVEY